MKRFRCLLWFIAMALLSGMAACQEGPGKSAFATVDTNGDGRIQKAEFLAEHKRKDYHQTWDENWDGRIGKAEWNSGLKQYFPDFTYGQDLYEKWQLDDDTTTVNPKELAHGLFIVYDADQDGTLKPEEYQAYPGTEG